jgi:cobalt/nickel transport system permease protein
MVGTAMRCASASCIGYAARKLRLDGYGEKKIPILGVMGAFVFAAQMVNFAIPGTGSSGHIGGGALLAGLVGGCPALLSISAVLVIQALFFADGGLLALGCNIFNMGVIPALVCYPLVFRPMLKGRVCPRRITIASIAASVIGLQLGALGVVAQTYLSGISELPFSAFALLMQPIHLAIGFVEGIVTAAILCFVHKMRPDIMLSAMEGGEARSGMSTRAFYACDARLTASKARLRASRGHDSQANPGLEQFTFSKLNCARNFILAAAAMAILVGGLLSHLASIKPDGLEWSIEKASEGAELEPKGAFLEGAAAVQEKTAIMPGYEFKGDGGEGMANGVENELGQWAKLGRMAPSAAGVIGAGLTFLLAVISAFVIVRSRRRQD